MHLDHEIEPQSPYGDAIHEAEWLTAHPTIDATRVLEVSVYRGHRIATLELAGGRGTSKWHRLPSELQSYAEQYELHWGVFAVLGKSCV